MQPLDPTAPAHHTPTGFRNLNQPPETVKKSLFSFMRMKYFGDLEWPDADTAADLIPKAPLDPNSLHTPALIPRVTWIGHATALVQYGDLTIMTDPVFSDRASPVSFAGPKRYTPPAVALEDLPPIDIVVISHNHYDHLDRETLRRLGDEVHYVVPLKNKALLSDLGLTKITELDWWDQTEIKGATITMTPTQHWSARGLFDRRKMLWGAYAIQFPDQGPNIWFGGDTGYNEVTFKEIGAKLGPFDLSLIPIGAYAPRWFMKNSHINPSEAVAIHQDIGSAYSVAIHWGAFILTAEPVDEPPKRLAEGLKAAGLPPEVFPAFALGESRGLPGWSDKLAHETAETVMP